MGGECDSKNELRSRHNINNQNQLITESQNIIKEECIIGHGKPTNKDEINELYEYESSMCKILYQSIEEGKIVNKSGTGFFCEINDDNIPFKKVLFTNNHVLNENRIENNKEIEFEYLNEIKKIKITEDRQKFTNEEIDYTCIEIFDKDKINNFFRIDRTIFNNKNDLKNKEIFILQYPNGQTLSHDLGKIIDIKDNKIKHSVSTLRGASGSPLIKRYNLNLILGIHCGGDKEDKTFNYAIPFDIIIKDIKDQLFNNKKNIINNNKIIEYRNKINLIYYKNNNYYDANNNIFGEKFVDNNKDNIKLIINDKPSKLISKYNLKEGINNIQIIIINKLTNLEEMFYDCISLQNIEELKYLNTKEINNFSYMFYKCSSLSDIKALQNWNVSNGNNFGGMFYKCSSLSDIKALQNWNVSNGNNFSYMFSECSKLIDIKSLEKLNVSNGLLIPISKGNR